MAELSLTLASIGIRLVLGVVLTVVFSFIGWFTAWMALGGVNPNTWGMFLPVTLPAIGGWTGLAAVLAWWNPPRSWRVAVLGVVFTIGGAVIASWIGYLIGMSNPYFTWPERGIVYPMQGAAVVGANLVAGGIYSIRALLRGQV